MRKMRNNKILKLFGMRESKMGKNKPKSIRKTERGEQKLLQIGITTKLELWLNRAQQSQIIIETLKVRRIGQVNIKEARKSMDRRILK